MSRGLFDKLANVFISVEDVESQNEAVMVELYNRGYDVEPDPRRPGAFIATLRTGVGSKLSGALDTILSFVIDTEGSE